MTVPSAADSMTWSMVTVNPGFLATPIHKLGGWIRVTFDVKGRLPFTCVVIFAPTAKSPSIFADRIGPPGQMVGLVHTAHTASGDAVLVLWPSKEGGRPLIPRAWHWPMTGSAVSPTDAG
ncbi:hypothetical protein [Mycobacterium sp. MMS18-G62]